MIYFIVHRLVNLTLGSPPSKGLTQISQENIKECFVYFVEIAVEVIICLFYTWVSTFFFWNNKLFGTSPTGSIIFYFSLEKQNNIVLVIALHVCSLLCHLTTGFKRLYLLECVIDDRLLFSRRSAFASGYNWMKINFKPLWNKFAF